MIYECMRLIVWRLQVWYPVRGCFAHAGLILIEYTMFSPFSILL